MKVVILAGGKGKRLGELTKTLPKPLMPVAGKPIIKHIMDNFSEFGITDFIVVVGYKKEDIMNYLGDGSRYGFNVRYIVQKEQLGTAHAISLVKNLVGPYFFVVYGDLIFDKNILLTLLQKKEKADCVIVSKKVKDPRKYGVLQVDGERVIGIMEKSENPPSNLINAGIYLFSKRIFDMIERTPLSPRGEYEVTDSISLLAKEGSVIHLHLPGHWVDIGTRDNLILASEMFA